MRKPKLSPALLRALAAVLVACLTALSAYVERQAAAPDLAEQPDLVAAPGPTMGPASRP